MKTYLLTLSLLAATAATAQTQVSGTVADSLSRKGEPYATVRLLNAQRKPLASFLTDENGHFSHTFQQQGRYWLSFSALGRKPLLRPIDLAKTPVQLDTLFLASTEATLGTAVVEAQKALVKMETGKVTYDTEADVDAQTYTLLDMLRKVPLVTVDGQDNVQVNGSSNFIVHVDGKPSPMFQSKASLIFKSLPASYVKRIEVSTSPGAKYDAEGVGGVLNLITHNNTAGGGQSIEGYNGNASVNAHNHGLQTSAFLSWRKKKLTLSLTVNSNWQSLRDIGASRYRERYNSPMDTAFFHSSVDQAQHHRWQRVNTNASYQLDDQNLFTLSAGWTLWKKQEDGNRTDRYWSSLSASPLSYMAQTIAREREVSTFVAADYQHTFKGVEGRRLTASYQFRNAPGRHYNSSLFDGTAPAVYDLTNRYSDGWEKTSYHVGQIDFTTPLAAGHELSVGTKWHGKVSHGKSDYYYQDAAGDYAFTPAASADYKQYAQIGAAYAEYEGEIKPFKVKAGLRYEHTWQQEKFYRGTTPNFSTNYANLVPHAQISWTPKQGHNLGLTYSQRIYRPSIHQLNPAVDQTSPSSITYGNVNLTAEQHHKVSFEYNFFSSAFYLNAQLSHRFTNNGFEQYRFYQNNLLHTTYGNVVKERREDLSVFANVNIGRKTRIYTNLSAAYVQYRSGVINQKNSGWQGSASMGVQHELPWKLKLSANLFGRSKEHSLQGYEKSFWGLHSSLTRSFLNDKLTVGAFVFQPLGGSIRQNTLVRGDDFWQEQNVKFKLSVVGLTLRFDFGNAKVKVAKVERTIDNNGTKSSGENKGGGLF